MGEKTPKHNPLVDLDDPLDLGDLEDRGPDTKRPSFDAQALAEQIESAQERVTLPPAPTYDMLRDSCRQMSIADAADELLDEDLIEEILEDKHPSTSAVHAKDSDAAQAARAAAANAGGARKK